MSENIAKTIHRGWSFQAYCPKKMSFCIILTHITEIGTENVLRREFLILQILPETGPLSLYLRIFVNIDQNKSTLSVVKSR